MVYIGQLCESMDCVLLPEGPYSRGLRLGVGRIAGSAAGPVRVCLSPSTVDVVLELGDGVECLESYRTPDRMRSVAVSVQQSIDFTIRPIERREDA